LAGKHKQTCALLLSLKPLMVQDCGRSSAGWIWYCHRDKGSPEHDHARIRTGVWQGCCADTSSAGYTRHKKQKKRCKKRFMGQGAFHQHILQIYNRCFLVFGVKMLKAVGPTKIKKRRCPLGFRIRQRCSITA
jgi:hypothetical protein